MKNSQKGFIVPVLIAIIAVLVISFGVYYYFSIKNSKTPDIAIKNNSATSTEQVVSPNTYTYKDYGLFLQQQNDAPTIPTKYIDDGVVASGPYTGFNRIVALRISGEIETDISYYVFITKDYKLFYYCTGEAKDLNNDTNATAIMDPTKVVGTVANIALNHPDNISLGNFVLVRQNYYPAISFEDLLTVSSSTELESKVPGLLFYSASGQPTGTEKTATNAEYLDGTNQVKVMDQFGLVYNYLVDSQENYARQLQSVNNSTNKFNNPFYITSQDFRSVPLVFSSYDVPFPGGCGYIRSAGYVLKNILPSDLKPLGLTARGMQLYTLNDPYHPLNKQEYNTKIASVYEANYSEAATQAEQMNGAAEPTYNEYVSQSPIIIIQDPWNRYIALGEFQFLEPGGCGKPVVYLYPQTPTEVKVTLEKPTRFIIDIPTYNNGWSVLANPNGTLVDLQPQYTDCNKLDTVAFGSEYATDACQNNSYPYLYWAGQVDNTYPQAQVGWVVSQSDLESFLSEKLTTIGLNEKEKSDMLSYWIPELKARNAPYYRLSLFQTDDMNKFAPMNITPTPDTLIRVFLDWSPLTDNKLVIPAEAVTHIDRKGFTAVEWGGLKQ